MFVDALVFFLLFVCASDQEGGRWRSVSPEGALRAGLRSEGRWKWGRVSVFGFLWGPKKKKKKAHP